jgi:hypothetical protein
MSRRNKEGFLAYLPDKHWPFIEYSFWGRKGCVQWLCDYHDFMIMKNDRLFADWIGKGMGAHLWEWIRLSIEMKGDAEKVRAEEERRAEARVCYVCQSPEVVEKSEDAIQVEVVKGLEWKTTGFRVTYFCKEHTALPQNCWTTVADMVEKERRRNGRLCTNCGSPKVVMRLDCDVVPVEYYCAEEIVPKSILSSSPDRIADWRRGEYDGYKFLEEAFQ